MNTDKNNALTAERLDQICRLLHERVTDCAATDAISELLDALRWRRAGEELPEPGVDVIVVLRDKHCYVAEINDPDDTGGERFWITDGDSDYVHAVDLWLPIPPRP